MGSEATNKAQAHSLARHPGLYVAPNSWVTSNVSFPLVLSFSPFPLQSAQRISKGVFLLSRLSCRDSLRKEDKTQRPLQEQPGRNHSALPVPALTLWTSFHGTESSGLMAAGQVTETGQKVPGSQLFLAGLCPTSETCREDTRGLHLGGPQMHTCHSDSSRYKMKSRKMKVL